MLAARGELCSAENSGGASVCGPHGEPGISGIKAGGPVICAMARRVSLLPWNRSEPFSLGLVKRTFLSAPVRGNLLQGLPPAEPGKP